MQLDEAWLRAHLPPELRGAPLRFGDGYRLDGLTVTHADERGGPDTVVYEAKDAEDLLYWQLEYFCETLPGDDQPDRKVWRWVRDRVVNDRWRYTERRTYDYDAIEDARLAGFERYLRRLHCGLPPERWEALVQERVRLMNFWYDVPHWDYDRERLCFIEISHSREHDRPGGPEEPQPGSVIGFVDAPIHKEDKAVPKYSERDLEDAAKFRAGVHQEALVKLRQIDPGITLADVVDRYPVEDYFEDNWEYPGKWYTYVAVPPAAKGRQNLIETIVRDTLSKRSAEKTAATKPAPKRAPARTLGTRLDVQHYDYERLFTLALDQQRRSCTLVGRDAAGRYILEKFEEYNRGSATGSVSAYYVLSYEEYRRCAKQALSTGMLTREEYRRACEGPDGEVVYRDARFTLGRKNGAPYLRADGKTYLLSCSPYEPCLYITDGDGNQTAVHNAFDPTDVLRDFSRGRTVMSITGREYSARDFCALVAYAAGRGSISFGEAERVFGDAPPRKAAAPKPPEAPEPKPPEEPKPEPPEKPAPELAASELPEARPFSVLYADYPDAEAEIYLVKDSLPCRGLASHRRALAAACRALAKADEDGWAWRFDVDRARGWPVSADAPFGPMPPDGAVNLRKAVLDPPHGNLYDDAGFDALCAVLFPKGRSRLEVFEWSTDWSDWFDDGHEWWGAMCYTVYDRSLDRYAVLLASATD